MIFCRPVFILVLLAWLSGPALRPLAAAPAGDVLVRLHWLGLKQISADTNAASLMKVWQLPQTTALVAQTLDKISRLPVSANTNTAALLRPLLDDLITNEFYLEVGRPANSSLVTRHSSLLLALRLPAARANLWRTNLPAALPAAEISQSGEWTLVGLGLGTNGSPAGFAARLAAVDPQFLSLITHHSSLPIWLEADFTPAGLAAVDPSLSSLVTRYTSLSHVHLTATGEAGDVLTRATLDFSRPLALTLPPWEIPTNLISQSLSSFTALRGLSGWLANQPAWQKLKFSPPPNQAFLWTESGIPCHTYFAIPLPAASNQLSQSANLLLPKINAWLDTNDAGHIEWRADQTGIFWNRVLIMSPFLKSSVFNQREWLFGGLQRLSSGDSIPLPSEIQQPIREIQSLIYIHAELTGELVKSALFVSQLLRFNLHRAQLTTGGVVVMWLKDIEPLMGGCTTVVTLSGSQELVAKRKSTIGFSALELNLLADWLESPQFPHGLHTFLAPPDQ